MAVRGAAASERARRALAELVKPRTKLAFFVLGHVYELDFARGAPGGLNCQIYRGDQLPRGRVPDSRHGDDYVRARLTRLERAEQPELTDAVEKAGVDNPNDGLLNRLAGTCHQRGETRVIRVLGDRGYVCDLGVMLSLVPPPVP